MFGALLDPARGGSFSLSPAIPFQVQRRYLERTNVLETVFSTAQGRVRVTDALTMDEGRNATWRELVRKVEGVSGTVPMQWRMHPRFEFGGAPGTIVSSPAGCLFRHGALQLGVRAFDAGEPVVESESVSGRFEVEAGRCSLLALVSTYAEPLPMPSRTAIERPAGGDLPRVARLGQPPQLRGPLDRGG